MKTPKLSDKDEVEIRAAYTEGGVTYRTLGNKYGVSAKTIERVIRRDTLGLSQKVKEIKKQNAVDVTQHIKNQSGIAFTIDKAAKCDIIYTQRKERGKQQ